MKTIHRVAVLGAGTMGSRIAAHFANAGVPSYLLDVDAAAVKRGIDSAVKSRAFYDAAAIALVHPGTFDDLSGCDWILEAVTEDLAVKREILAKIPRRPGTIISTNTSGIPLSAISAGFDEDFRRHFLGTHFFNPPRYLRLVELVRGADTLPPVADFIKSFIGRRMGKGVIECRDTPNFIANRIGSFFASAVQKLTVEDNYSLEEADLLTGPLIGMPKSASYRLLDIVGLDVWDRVMQNSGEAGMAPFLKEMVQRGWLGDKTGQGCYKRLATGEILVLDWKSLEYRTPVRPRFDCVDHANGIDDLRERLRYLSAQQDRAGHFIRTVLQSTIDYAQSKLAEIAYAPSDINNAMRWGYNWSLGPFEWADAIAPASGDRTRVPAGRCGASLVNLGDDVRCVELHGSTGLLDREAFDIFQEALASDCRALVVGNSGTDFSSGSNLLPILLAARDGEWEELSAAIHRLQQMNLSVKYAPIPVVAAIFQRVNGIGCEVALHSTAVQALAELQIGLIDTGTGLLPATGGCKELLIRNTAKAFDLIFAGKVSSSAREAFTTGYLRPPDGLSMNPDFLMEDAKALALHLSWGYVPRVAPAQISTADGDRLKLGLYIARQGEFISAHDSLIGHKLAHVLSAGGKPSATEQELLELEREAFLSLCGHPLTQQRIEHMLKTGKSLKN